MQKSQPFTSFARSSLQKMCSETQRSGNQPPVMSQRAQILTDTSPTSVTTPPAKSWSHSHLVAALFLSNIVITTSSNKVLVRMDVFQKLPYIYWHACSCHVLKGPVLYVWFHSFIFHTWLEWNRLAVLIIHKNSIDSNNDESNIYSSFFFIFRGYTRTPLCVKKTFHYIRASFHPYCARRTHSSFLILLLLIITLKKSSNSSCHCEGLFKRLLSGQ